MIDLSLCTKRIIPLICDIVDKLCVQNYDVELKGKGNFVTTTDIAIEDSLIKELKCIIPQSGFVSEESGEELSNDYNWIIDPIDGTTNYIHGFPYAVSVALSYKSINNIVLGVVYSPLNNSIYYACKGKGSYLIRGEKIKKLHTDSNSIDGIAIFGMPYNRDKTSKILSVVEKYYPFFSDIKRIGPSSLDICLVAEGKADVYFELDLKLWDIAAGILILLEAGGDYKQVEDLFVFGKTKVIDLFYN